MILSGLWKKWKKINKPIGIKYCCNCKYFRRNSSDISTSLCTHDRSILNNAEMLVCDERVEPSYSRCTTMRELSLYCTKSAKYYEKAK